MIFPTVKGFTLDGHQVTLPTGLDGEYNLLVIAFQQCQRVQVDMWMSHLRSLCTRYPNLHAYELPTIQNLLTLQNDFTDAWTRRGVSDPTACRTTIPLYVDINDFNRALNIPTVSTTYSMLVDREGEVLWRMQGGYDLLKIRSLLITLNKVCRVRQPASAGR